MGLSTLNLTFELLEQIAHFILSVLRINGIRTPKYSLLQVHVSEPYSSGDLASVFDQVP